MNNQPKLSNISSEASDKLVIALSRAIKEAGLKKFIYELSGDVNWDAVPESLDEACLLVLKLYDMRPGE